MNELRVIGDEIYFNSYRLGARPASMPASQWDGVRHAVDRAPGANEEPFDMVALVHEMWRAGLELHSITRGSAGDYAIVWVGRKSPFAYSSDGHIFLQSAFSE